MKLSNIKQLLSQVQTITNSYNRLSEANGDNFNIFSILKIESDEVRTHSRFIAEMLNPNGVHGFEDEFLKLFIKTLEIKTNIKTSNCDVIVEAYQGMINNKFTKGGSIDILIKEKGSSDNVIMIENKIYAGEQRNQLLRYHNAYPKGKLIFLTLFGDNSQEKSSKEIDYVPVSYQTDIINWLEKCKMLAVDNPTLRETLKQYINLVKKLTNQNISKEMNEELAKLLTRNEENFTSYMSIMNSINSIKYQTIKDKVIPILTELKNEFEELDSDATFEFNEDQLLNSSNKGLLLLRYENSRLKEQDLIIEFHFEGQNHNDLVGGLLRKNQNVLQDVKVYDLLKEKFSKPLTNNYWLFSFHYRYFMNWTKDLNDLKNLIFGKFKDDLRYKINTMLEAVKEKKY